MDKITTIIFDLDGTLVDTLPDIADAMNRVLANHGQEIRPPHHYRALIGGGIRSMVDRLAPDYDQTDQARLGEEFVALYSEHLCEKTICYRGIANVVEDLHAAGYTLAILSNKRHDLTERIVRHFLRPGAFKAIRGHVAGAARKPNPVPTRALLKALAAEPTASILIGDTAIDAETARAVNIDFLGVRWGYRAAETLVDAGAETIFDHAEQILEWVGQKNSRERICAAAIP